MVASKGFDKAADLVAAIVLALARSAVLLVLIAGLCMSLTYGLRQATNAIGNDWLLSLAFALLALAIFASSIALARRPRPLPIFPFWLGTMLAGILLHAGYVLWAQPYWVSDFLQYWLLGLDLAQAPVAQVSTIYEQRATFFTVPVVQLFGDSRVALQLCNIAWLAVIQACGYDAIRRVASHPAAQAFCVLWISALEPMFAAGIPSHDLLGLALFVMAFWIAVLATRPECNGAWTIRVAAGICAGALLAWLDALRGIGMLYLAVLALLVASYVAVHALRSRRLGGMPVWLGRAVQHTATATTVALLIGALFASTGSILAPDAMEVARIRHTTAHATSFSDGTYRFGRDFSRAFLEAPQVEVDALADFQRAIALNDLHAPLQKLRSTYERMPRQYALGSQHPFYLTGTPPTLRAAAVRYGDYYLVGFTALLLYALWRRMHAPLDDPAGSFLVLFVTALSLLLLLVGENQPRYLFPIWFIGAYLIATSLAGNTASAVGVQGAKSSAASSARAVGIWSTTALAVLATGLVAIRILAQLASTPANGRILTYWHFSTAPGGEARLRQIQTDASLRAAFHIGGTTLGDRSLKLMLTRPPKFERAVTASTEVCDIATGSSLEFLYDFRAKRVRVAAPFDLVVRSSQDELWRATLPNPGPPEWVSVPLQPDASGCASLRFTLEANVDYDSPSWVDASHVEIFFPRLRTP